MLKPITKHDKASRYLVIDIETYEDGTPYLMGLYDGSNFYLFEDVGKFVDYLIDRKETLVYAHAGMRFDYALLLRTFIQKFDAIDILYSGSVGIFATVKVGKREITLADSFKLLPASLRELSDKFVPEAPKIELDAMPWELPKHECIRYLERDCYTLYEVLRRFWEQIDKQYGKTRSLTISSLALKLYRKHFQKYNFLCSNKKIEQFERDSYFGGIVYCQPGSYEHIVSVDVNSMYPYVMSKYSYPYSYVGHYTTTYQGRFGLYRGKYKTPQHLLPFVYDIETRSLAYEGLCIIDHQTIDYIKQIGGSFDCDLGYVYYRYDDIFSEFVNHFYTLKKTSTEPYKTIYKIILNSLYGKFGQKRKGRMLSTEKPNGLFKSYAVPLGDGLHREVFDFEKLRMVRHSFPAIASFITLNARRYLHHLSTFGDCIYADTDSLHFVDSLPSSIPLGDELGQCKIEYEGKARYVDKKVYEHLGINKVKMKGVPRPPTTFDGLMSPTAFEFTSFVSINQQLRTGTNFHAYTSKRTIDFEVLKDDEL